LETLTPRERWPRTKKPRNKNAEIHRDNEPSEFPDQEVRSHCAIHLRQALSWQGQYLRSTDSAVAISLRTHTFDTPSIAKASTIEDVEPRSADAGSAYQGE